MCNVLPVRCTMLSKVSVPGGLVHSHSSCQCLCLEQRRSFWVTRCVSDRETDSRTHRCMLSLYLRGTPVFEPHIWEVDLKSWLMWSSGINELILLWDLMHQGCGKPAGPLSSPPQLCWPPPQSRSWWFMPPPQFSPCQPSAHTPAPAQLLRGE